LKGKSNVGKDFQKKERDRQTDASKEGQADGKRMMVIDT
jgi:hypothetical protein